MRQYEKDEEMRRPRVVLLDLRVVIKSEDFPDNLVPEEEEGGPLVEESN